ncbi:MAG: serine hydrolase [Candidatus Limnocylindria bacterium]
MSVALRSRIEDLAAETGGVVGVAATRLADARHLGYREDELFPTASVIKVPILVTLYEEALAGRVDLAERVTYRSGTKVAGSGVLQDLDDGLSLTLRDLAVLMITVSDNTATDLLLERVSKERVEEAMRRYGLASIRIPFTIRELLGELADVAPDAPDAYETMRARLRGAQGSGGRAVIPEASDRASPKDLCRLFELLESRTILDEAACVAILDINQRQKFGDIIPARLPKGTITAHKTGSIRGVRNDAGIVYAPNGPYAITICSRGMPDEVLGTRALAEISLVVWEELAA